MLTYLTKNNNKESYSSKLYSYHFSLFHSLYEIKYRMGKKGYFLNIDTMRIRLIEVPKNGCTFYESEKGTYCANSESKQGFCEKHQKYRKNNDLVFDLLRDFYLNKENIKFSEDKIFQKLYQGYMLYSLNKDKTDSAIKFFDLQILNSDNLKRKYHKLAKMYHPDKSIENLEKMKIINNHYQVLSEVLSL